ncbi:MAG TPA: hypothetical protein VFU63_04485 [Ktedonobacterales bacterium]|nr:hypothetical protein [Ktedonobacterales bacterium]
MATWSEIMATDEYKAADKTARNAWDAQSKIGAQLHALQPSEIGSPEHKALMAEFIRLAETRIQAENTCLRMVGVFAAVITSEKGA